jgi:streptogramin lyase
MCAHAGEADHVQVAQGGSPHRLGGGPHLLPASVVQAASIGTLKQFKTPTADIFPNQIAQGSDGNMWFTGSPGTADHFVARITPDGDITEFAACSSCFPDDIAQGPDGILYFTNNDALLGRITTAGEVLTGGSPGLATHGSRLAIHADTVWITDFVSDAVWRYDITAETFTSIAPPTPNSNPGDIAVDANGVVWFAETSPLPGAIASYDPAANVFTETPVPAGAGFPSSVAVAADGTVWYAKAQGDRVGRLDPVTREITEFPVGAGDRPAEIAASPDGSLWFTQILAGKHGPDQLRRGYHRRDEADRRQRASGDRGGRQRGSLVRRRPGQHGGDAETEVTCPGL